MQKIFYPTIQTTNQETNRIQNNTNTALASLAQQVSQVTLIGEIKYSTLTLDQVQRQLGNSWVAANGATCSNTTYNQITGFTKLPNIPTASGISAFIRIN